ncbi:MAG: NAD(P)H-hydrate epimerase [Lachnospiraceae bacterium]
MIVDAIWNRITKRNKGAFMRLFLINNSNAIIYSVDIPSGISSKTGEVINRSKADITITFGYENWDVSYTQEVNIVVR